mmetsp:Transcript_45693/g.115494  ORF Transcript_45693/g.115494 Transcript_45693/m.115494 type:complete len:163 (+) Transcript_45693:191-679(+)
MSIFYSYFKFLLPSSAIFGMLVTVGGTDSLSAVRLSGQVLGHSLGGAVAAALAVKLHSAASAELSPPGREGPARSPGGGLSEALGLVGEDAANAPPSVSAITFGAPPCFCNGTHLQAAATELVETYIHGNDVVAWLSEGNISSLMIRADRSWRHARGFSAPP